MPERASIFQTVQIGVESTSGSAAAANKLLQALSISPAPKTDIKNFRASGMKFPSVSALGKEWTESKLSGAATYTELVYPLASVLSYTAPTKVGPSLAYSWTFSPATSSADTVKTFTVEQGSSTRAHKFTFGQVTGLSLSFSRSGIELGGTMIGRQISDGITMTSTPTAIDLVPVLPTQVDVYLADTAAGLSSATAMSRALSVDWEISGRFNGVFPLSSGSSGYVTVVEAEPKLTVKLKAEADSEGMALLTQMRSGASKFMRIKCVGSNIETTYYYTLQIDTALQVSDVSEFSDADGIFAIEWSFVGVHDATWGKATEVTVINKLTSL